MIASRIALCTPPTAAAAQVEAAQVAELHGFDVFFVTTEAPAGTEADSYNLVTAAGVAGATDDVRVGLRLSLGHPGSLLRMAEDVGVVDQCAGGRVELLVEGGSAAAQPLVDLLRECPVDGGVLPVTPGPFQAEIPVTDPLVVGAAETAAIAAGGVDTLRPFIDGLRQALGATTKTTILFEVEHGAGLDETAAVLGRVVGPVLRAPVEETPRMLADAWRWHQAGHWKGVA